MESHYGRVVRDFDLRADCRQFIQCSLFGAIRVRRRHDAHRLPLAAMTSKCFQKRANAAPPHKRHDDVNGVRRMNLGANLMPQRWFTARVRQERRIQERGQGCLERVWGSIGLAPQDGRQDARGLEGQIDLSLDRIAHL